MMAGKVLVVAVVVVVDEAAMVFGEEFGLVVLMARSWA